MSLDEDGGGRIWAVFCGYPQSTQNIPQPAANLGIGGLPRRARPDTAPFGNGFGAAMSSSP